MIIRKGTGCAAVILAVTISQSLMAAPQGPRNNQQQAAAPSIGPVAATEPELTAFRAIQAETNPTTRLTLADTFLATYPTSEFRGYIQRFRMEAFVGQNKPKDVIAAGEAALDLETKFVEQMIAKADADAAVKNRPRNAAPPLDKNSPEFKTFVSNVEQSKLYYYLRIMTGYQQLNDAAKALEYGERALKQDPENLQFLMNVSYFMSERVPQSELDKEPHLKRAEELSKKAVAKLPEFLNSPTAAAMAPAAKAGLTSDVHFTLGTVYLAQKKYGDAQKEFLTAIASKKTDPISYFRLGLAYAQATPERADEAMEALAKSVYLKGITEAQATDILKKMYQAKKKSLDGFDEFVKDAGQKISQ